MYLFTHISCGMDVYNFSFRCFKMRVKKVGTMALPWVSYYFGRCSLTVEY